jgi:hypothetical protein
VLRSATRVLHCYIIILSSTYTATLSATRLLVTRQKSVALGCATASRGVPHLRALFSGYNFAECYAIAAADFFDADALQSKSAAGHLQEAAQCADTVNVWSGTQPHDVVARGGYGFLHTKSL